MIRNICVTSHSAVLRRTVGRDGHGQPRRRLISWRLAELSGGEWRTDESKQKNIYENACVCHEQVG